MQLADPCHARMQFAWSSLKAEVKKFLSTDRINKNPLQADLATLPTRTKMCLLEASASSLDSSILHLLSQCYG